MLQVKPNYPGRSSHVRLIPSVGSMASLYLPSSLSVRWTQWAMVDILRGRGYIWSVPGPSRENQPPSRYHEYLCSHDGGYSLPLERDARPIWFAGPPGSCFHLIHYRPLRFSGLSLFPGIRSLYSRLPLPIIDLQRRIPRAPKPTRSGHRRCSRPLIPPLRSTPRIRGQRVQSRLRQQYC